MSTLRVMLAAGAAALLLPAAGLIQAQKAVGTGSAWIHVRVAEADGSQVGVNLPLSLARVASEILPDKMAAKPIEKLREKGWTLADLRRLWAEVKASGDAELVTVDSPDEQVRVVREGDLIRVNVRNSRNPDKSEQVKVEIPVDVVDALLSGDEDEVNLPAAIAKLSERRGDIVSVDDGKSTVRIWIDERS